ncbi:hypothetical protein BS17DRAFT_185574 [Gyrodon lividus]|nr:hypothetical protein BS17DRAFT_185574 [Gyrodon lividus]
MHHRQNTLDLSASSIDMHIDYSNDARYTTWSVQPYGQNNACYALQNISGEQGKVLSPIFIESPVQV